MNDLIKKDLKYLWHPYTQMKDCERMPPIPIKNAKGIKLFDHDGNFYYDTISSWWCNVHGHNHPRINDAITAQLKEFEHVLFAGFTHSGAVGLAERLVNITPPNLSRVFYSDNGSTAVEVAMKMSFQYWLNRGVEGKTAFLSLDSAYHGDTIGAMSVSGVDLFNKKFCPLFFDSYKAKTPYCYRCPEGKDPACCGIECFGSMRDILERHHDRIAAVILEPLLMGAGGMIVYPEEYLRKAREITRKHDVHLILDEVATGFGRTGSMFACERAGVEPDLMCLSKGITSGYLPIGVTLATEDIFRAFYADYGEHKTFYHGHTFTANPLACAAACASIDLFGEENTLDNVDSINSALSSYLEKASKRERVGDTRCIGSVGAMELVKDKASKERFGGDRRIGAEVYLKGLENNILLRPLGDVIYFFLPLSATPEELDDIFLRTDIVLDSLNI